jgi:tetratricopeptide (TPR) repeat protein
MTAARFSPWLLLAAITIGICWTSGRDAHGATREDRQNKAMPPVEEVASTYAETESAAWALIETAEEYERLGREADAVEAYRHAALTIKPEKRDGYVVRSHPLSRAHRWLGEYYTHKQDWAEALTWWQAWQPYSDCGNCRVGLDSRRQYMIAKCLLKTGRLDEAEEALAKPECECESCQRDSDALLAEIRDEQEKRRAERLRTGATIGGAALALILVVIIFHRLRRLRGRRS